MRVAFDGSSVLWTGLLVGQDVEGQVVEHNGRKINVNSAAYGYENVVNSVNSALRESNGVPSDMIWVIEGRDSKKRRVMIEPTYKANREGEKDSRPPEAYVEFNKLKEQITGTYRNLGAIGLTQPFVEGDDVLAYLAKHTEEDLVIVTGDNDLIVLNGVNEYGATVSVRVSGVVGVNKYGDFDFKLVTLYKALVGDTSDNIKGCVGFGEASWMKLNIQYGDDGCFELQALIAAGKRDEIAQIAKENNCKLLGKIVEQWDGVRKSLRLAELHPEWVNTIKQPLEWLPGMVARKTDDERLTKWRAASRLVTADKFDASLVTLKKWLAETRFVAFDIETSTPVESDDWLDALGEPNGVDVFGSYLVSYAITFGANSQYTFYVPVKHADTDNVTMVQARQMLETCFDAGKEIVIQNTAFELSVLYSAADEDGSLWSNHWKKYGQGGMVPNIRDTLFESSYVNENVKLGLKFRSQMYLEYTQATYQETMTVEGIKGKLPKGGRMLAEEDYGEHGVKESRLYKMHELSAAHCFKYGIDDTICTAALHNFYKLHMQLEHHYQVYLDVELDAAYLHARSFHAGITVSIGKCKELEKDDTIVYDAAWAILRKYLMENGWAGTVPPTYTKAINAKEIKEAYSTVMGLDDAEEEDDEDEEDSGEPVAVVKDAFLGTRVRTPAKLVALLQSLGHDEFAAHLQGCLDGDGKAFTDYVRRHFTGEPKFKASNKQMQVLLYTVMALPIRVRGKATEKMRAAGVREGNPKGNALAIAYAERDASEGLLEVLQAISLMQMVRTRRGLYYNKYPYFVHWKDGRIHSSHNQCATNTRRASSSKPNVQQLPKHPKIEGYKARFREVLIPHRKTAVIVSMDFSGQELRVIADYSQDQNMLDCFVGDNKKDMHSLTAAGILFNKNKPLMASLVEALPTTYSDQILARYYAFMGLADTMPKVYKEYRPLGKKVNFTSEFGAAAPKLAETLLIEESEAQAYLDAKEAAFPRAAEWKKEVQDGAKSVGFVRTMLGAVRHLAPMLNSEDRFIASKADRQAVNFKVQSSSAEMTKLAEGRMHKAELLDTLDCRYYGPVHDEVVWSVDLSCLETFLVQAHACMAKPYAAMAVPIESSISFGWNFSDQIEIGDSPTHEAIAAGLVELQAA
jgi:5'-3' exonuclease